MNFYNRIEPQFKNSTSYVPVLLLGMYLLVSDMPNSYKNVLQFLLLCMTNFIKKIQKQVIPSVEPVLRKQTDFIKKKLMRAAFVHKKLVLERNYLLALDKRAGIFYYVIFV